MLKPLNLLIGFAGVLFLSSVVGPSQVHAQTSDHDGACVLISSDRTYTSADIITLNVDEILLPRVDHIATEWRERQFARGSQFRTVQPREGFEAFASIWQCKSEQDIRQLVAWRLEQSALMFNAKPDVFLVDGRNNFMSRETICPHPMLNEPMNIGWWSLNGSALVYDKETGKFTIVEGNVRVHNRASYVTQSTSICSNDDLLQRFVVGLRSQGTYVPPTELVDIVPVLRNIVLDELDLNLP